jgi:hypothetical protein
MGINDLYSKRKKRIERAGQPDVYQYERLPIEFRRQVIHIWLSAIGEYREPERVIGSVPLISHLWHIIHDSFARELGLFHLGSEFQNPFDKCKSFLLSEDTHVDNVLDLIEFTFRQIDHTVRNLLQDYRHQNNLSVSQLPDDAISELNHRFREYEIGYQYSNGQIIRVDSGFIHAEVVVPALSLLSSQQFSGAEQEFRNAHEHYRKQEYKDAIVDALNAFESTMKTICDKCNWSYSKTASAKELINVVLEKELVPKYLQTHLSSLRAILESGVPTVRNKTSGHGQGAKQLSVPEYLAAYVLHLTASNVVLLVEAYQELAS